MSKILYRAGGIIKLSITGAGPEAVLNACAFSGIELWGLKCLDAYSIEVFAHERQLEDIRKICVRCRCDAAVLSVRGGSRWRGKVKRRLGLVIAAVIVFAALIISSLFIWDIDIEGNNELSSGEILRNLAECGVVEGRFWPGLPVDMIRSRVIVNEPDIAWLTVNVRGSRATVLVEERAAKPEVYSESSSADIIAARSGVIRQMSVMNGKPLAVCGQPVLAGDVLISGAVDSITGDMRYVRALGVVQAETWYELTAVCPVQAAQKNEKSKSNRRFALKVGKNRINFYFGSGKDIDVYDKIIHEYKLGVSGLFTLPISVISEKLISYEHMDGKCCAAAELESGLEAWLRDKIDGQVIELDFSRNESAELLYVTMQARCLENIAETAELPQGDRKGNR